MLIIISSVASESFLCSFKQGPMLHADSLPVIVLWNFAWVVFLKHEVTLVNVKVTVSLHSTKVTLSHDKINYKVKVKAKTAWIVSYSYHAGTGIHLDYSYMTKS